MIELQKQDFGRVLRLIEPEPLTYFQVVVRAMAEGTSQGRIWADDEAKPTTAFVWDGGPVCGLAGEPGNKEMNSALASLIAEEVGPAATQRGIHFAKIFYSPKGWERRANDIFGAVPPGGMDRMLYALDKPKIANWQEQVPASGTIERITADLLQRDTLVNLDRVRGEIACCWTSEETFLERGVGFCAVYGSEVVCWCTGEYASGRDIGIGIETVEEQQGKGFATATAAAFVEHCAANGLCAYWDARKDNLPSLAVAEKVGFKQVSEYQVLMGTLSPGRAGG